MKRAPRRSVPAAPTAPPPPPVADETLLEDVQSALDALVGESVARQATETARELLTNRNLPATLHDGGIRALLQQLVRNRDPEMQANHLTELRVAFALSRVSRRTVELERRGNDRNERRVDFAIDDKGGTTLVEVKNLNLPLIKKSTDPVAASLRDALRGFATKSDLHLSYLFFRRPHADEQARLADAIRDGWRRAEEARGGLQVFFSPGERPRVGAIVSPARRDGGGRVLVYDHGQHLRAQPGARLRISHHARPSLRRPRERLEEMFIKDNVLRRIQDAEQKFPIDGTQGRVVLLCPGPWAPALHVDRCVREAVHWYLEGSARPDDLWASYYPHWAGRWSFRPLRNIDAIYLVRAVDDGTPGVTEVTGGDVTLGVRTVFERTSGLAARIFFGA